MSANLERFDFPHAKTILQPLNRRINTIEVSRLADLDGQRLFKYINTLFNEGNPSDAVSRLNTELRSRGMNFSKSAYHIGREPSYVKVKDKHKNTVMQLSDPGLQRLNIWVPMGDGSVFMEMGNRGINKDDVTYATTYGNGHGYMRIGYEEPTNERYKIDHLAGAINGMVGAVRVALGDPFRQVMPEFTVAIPAPNSIFTIESADTSGSALVE